MNKASQSTSDKPTISTTTRKKPSSKVKQARKEVFPRKKPEAPLVGASQPE